MLVVRIKRSHLRALLASVVLGVGAFGAVAALADDPAGVIHACAQNSTGSLRVVGSASDCRSNETHISWSKNGTIPAQACPAGQFVTGIGSNGQFTCAAPPPPAYCGNGTVDAGEACDSAGNSASCDYDCTVAVCGDGVVNPAAGEQCEDGNLANGDGCNNFCRLEP